MICINNPRRSVAQLVEHRSPKPGVGGSSPSSPANVSLGVYISLLYDALIDSIKY